MKTLLVLRRLFEVNLQSGANLLHTHFDALCEIVKNEVKGCNCRVQGVTKGRLFDKSK